jgi:hypothetical protein
MGINAALSDPKCSVLDVTEVYPSSDNDFCPSSTVAIERTVFILRTCIDMFIAMFYTCILSVVLFYSLILVLN